MYGNNLDADKLGIRDLVGEPTGNALINWVKGLATTSQYLTTSPNANGSIDIDLNFALVANTILSLVERIAADFKATISKNSLAVAGGHILLPGETHIMPQYTKNLASGDDGKCLCLTSDASDSEGGAAAWQYEWLAAFPAGIVSGSVVRLPICTVSRTGGAWGVLQHHLGAFVFAVPPAPLVAGYDAAKMQSLDHLAGGALAWTTYGECLQ